MIKDDIATLRYIAGNIEQDQREHSARKLRDIADRLETATIQATPIYQRRQVGGSWTDTTLLGKQAWDEAGWPTRVVVAIQEPVMVAEPDKSNLAGYFVYVLGAWCVTSSDDPRAVKLYRSAPMVADPAGVALTDDQIRELWTESNIPSAENDYITGFLLFARGVERATLAATVKAVPSEALDVEPSEMQVLAAAIELSNRCADECCVDRRDYWKQYSDSIKVEARACLVAAFAAPLADKK